MLPEPHLPYSDDALEPHLSRKAMREHLGAHRLYVDKVNRWIAGVTDLRFDPKQTRQFLLQHRRVPPEIRTALVQSDNHYLFWNSMTPDYASLAEGALADEIERVFGGPVGLRRHIAELAQHQFGSGWIWLSLHGGQLLLSPTTNGVRAVGAPLFNLDLWEHAWWLDYPNKRHEYAQTFVDDLIDWRAADRRFVNAREGAEVPK